MSDMSWRFPLLLQSIIGTILAVGTLFLPESPRWLLDTDQDDEGMGVLADLHGDGDPEDERVSWSRPLLGLAERAVDESRGFQN